jgi:hypothetical protein
MKVIGRLGYQPALLPAEALVPMRSAAFSAMARTVALVLAHGNEGITEASATRNLSMPWTRRSLSVTAVGPVSRAAGPGRVEVHADALPQVGGELVVGSRLRTWDDFFGTPGLECVGVAQISGCVRGAHHEIDVALVGQKGWIYQWCCGRVRGGQLDRPAAMRAKHAEADGVTVLGNSPAEGHIRHRQKEHVCIRGGRGGVDAASRQYIGNIVLAERYRLRCGVDNDVKWMVGQVGTHTGQVRDDVDTMPAKLFCGPNARQQQQMR